ncbi:kelch-like protein 15 [Saccostrea cucullata]|uniref:kelch-like protein 15 n=1 Tax=Saccostrea cuccullata TaxID=36930 RepID=UPI002ED6A85F
MATEIEDKPFEKDDYSAKDENYFDSFPCDPELTDLTLVVEEKKLHVIKAVLMDASPVFRKMFTDDFKEKNAAEVHLPGKEYSIFVLFLRCIFPREHVTLSERSIEDLLPLAHEYDVKCILRECETWLLTELEFKKAKVENHYVNVENDVEYLTKCLYYGSEYCLRELYAKAFQLMIPHKLTRYKTNQFYQKLPEKNKRELIEARLTKIEEMGTLLNTTNSFGSSGLFGQQTKVSTTSEQTVFQCSANLFI